MNGPFSEQEVKDLAKNSRFRPLLDRVLVLRDKSETQSKGGIIFPDIAIERKPRGTIIAVGPGAWGDTRWTENKRQPMGVKVGDYVTFEPFAGMDNLYTRERDGFGRETRDGEELLLMREGSILGVVDR